MSRCLQLVGRALIVSVSLLVGLAPAAGAQSSLTGPEVSLDRSVLEPGDRVVLNIDGFESPNVTISVCGNEARRGSVDCNMYASEGLRLDTDGTSTVIQIPVAAPPVPCPCVIRVANRTFDEIAISPIELIGHPVEPVIESPGFSDAVDVSISAVAAPDGLFDEARTSLGGPATYEVTVTVKNRSTVPFSAVSLAGTVGRGGDQLATIALDDPGQIAPGRTWQQVVTAEVPGPSFGDLAWQVDVFGAGPTVTAVETTEQRPTLLIVLVLVLVADVFLLVIRFMVRRRAARAAKAAAATPDDPDAGAVEPEAPPGQVGDHVGDQVVDAAGDRSAELVSSAS